MKQQIKSMALKTSRFDKMEEESLQRVALKFCLRCDSKYTSLPPTFHHPDLSCVGMRTHRGHSEIQNSSLTKRNRNRLVEYAAISVTCPSLVFACFIVFYERKLLTPNNILEYSNFPCISFNISCVYFKTVMLGSYKLITVLVSWWILFISNVEYYFPILCFLTYIYLKITVFDFCFIAFAY